MKTIAFADLDERASARRGIISQDLFFLYNLGWMTEILRWKIKKLHLVINFGVIKQEIISWDILWSIHKTCDQSNSYYKLFVKIIFI